MKKIFNCEQMLTGVSKIAYRNLLTTLLSLALITTSCTDEADTLASKGASLQLKVKTAGIESRGLIESTTLPDGHSIGLSLVDAGGSTYDNISYQNIQATASTGATPQTWALASDMLLSSTSGTLYGYYPHSGTVDDITQIPVTAGDTDYMYATPVTGLNDGNYNATVTMNHALAAIRLNIVRGTYTGTGAVTAVSVSGDNIATAGTLNARTGGLTGLSGAGTAITNSTAFTLSTTAEKRDFIFVPVGATSAAPTITMTIDGSEYIVTADATSLEQGNIYEYTLTVDAKDISLSDVKVGDWGYNDSGNPVINAGYKITLAGDTEGIAFSNIVNDDGSVTITAVPVEGSEYVVDVVTLDNTNATLQQSYNEVTGVRTIQLSDISNDIIINFNGLANLDEYGWVVATYNVTDNSSDTQLLYSSFGLANIAEMKVLENVNSRSIADAQSITRARTYKFASTGIHIVYVKFTDVTSIGNTAFYNLPELTSVTIGSGVTSIGTQAFCHNKNLTSVIIGSGVTSIGSQAFGGCTGLTEITIPESVTSIGSLAFYNCTGLTSVTIPESVTSIKSRAFEGCTGLISIVVDAANPIFDSRNNCNAIMKTATNTLIAACKNTVIPEDCKIIGESAFYRCTGITNITIPNSVTSIGEYAFYMCTGLTNITIPNSVTSIGSNAFESCDGLTNITIPESVTSIEKLAFGGCTGLTEITIPESVTSIGGLAFSECTGLTNITIPESVTSIGGLAFSECTGLTSVTIGSGVTSIGTQAFGNCTELESITSLATTAPTIINDTFQDVKLDGKLTVPSGSTGYDVWMGTGYGYLGGYRWTLVESSKL